MSIAPAPGSFVRRKRDGMIGRVGRTWSYNASASHRPVTTDVVWIGEWTVGNLHGKSDYEILTGDEAATAAARFAALTCPACNGSGKADPYRRCAAPNCRMGRLIGIDPAFDAAAADYERRIQAEIERDMHRYSSGKREPAPEREMELRYWATCTDCEKRLTAGSTALGRKTNGSWQFRCPSHAA